MYRRNKAGTHHSASTPIGMKVICESELIKAEGRKLVFKITVSDECGVIGESMHERFIVESGKFRKRPTQNLRRAYDRKDKRQI